MQLVPWVLCITLIVRFTDIREMSWNFEVFSEKKRIYIIKAKQKMTGKDSNTIKQK